MKRPMIAAALAALLLAGCGNNGPKSYGNIDQHGLENDIEDSIAKQAGITATVVCPGDIPIIPGNTFHCLAKARGQRAMYTVTIENKEGDVTWRGSGAGQ